MSNKRTISLDRRRLEQLQILADRQGLRGTEWIERHIAEEWAREFPSLPVPGIKVAAVATENGPKVELVLNLDGDHGDEGADFGVLTISPELALKLAFGLRGITLREITNFNVPLEQDGVRVKIRRRGQGVTWDTEPREMHRAGFAATPVMALEIADCIERVAKRAMTGEEGANVAGAPSESGEGVSSSVDRGPNWGTW